jgi:subtilisin family serine protease
MSQAPEEYGHEILEQEGVGLHKGAGGPFLFRTGQIVVDHDTVERIGDVLAQNNATPIDDDAVWSQTNMRCFALSGDGLDTIAVIEKARAMVPGAVSPNHVILGAPARCGGPANDAEVADPPVGLIGGEEDGAGVTIAVLDTGVASQADVRTLSTGRDVDELDSRPIDDALDLEAGHGTFIAGILNRIAPAASVRSVKVLDTLGIGDDLTIAAGLLRCKGDQVVNLSLGGPALDAAGVPVLERAIDALDRSAVVIASAGNEGAAVPFFPAAFKRVISVGALAGDARTGWRRASFSNYGWWVDACAPGVKVHSVFPRFQERREPMRDFSAGGARWDGTSFAAPQVAAAIATLATRHGISCELAAWHLVQDPSRPRLRSEQLGTIVDPSKLDEIRI